MSNLSLQVKEIHLKITELVAKFEKAENTKALENEIQKEFKKVRQLLANSPKDNTEALSKLMIEKEEKTKYILECKKDLNKPELRQIHLKKLNDMIDKVNNKISEFQKNVKDSNKRKKNNWEKITEFLKSHLAKLDVIRGNLETGKLYSVQNMDHLFNNYLEHIFVSAEDSSFQEDTEQIYNSMFILANIKEVDIGEVAPTKEAPPKEAPSKEIKEVMEPKEHKDKMAKEENVVQSMPKREFESYMALSFENLPRWNDYISPKEIKDVVSHTSIFPEYKMVDLSAISKMSNDTLFFIFYYQKQQIEQYFAAKELKHRTWRYHIKYQNWFRRYDQPTQETAEFEKGSYIFFDYEKFWGNRRRADFMMKYHSLEDKI